LGALLLSIAITLPAACQERDAAGLPIVSKAVTSVEAVQIALTNSPTLAARKAAVAAFAARANAAGSMTKLQLATTTFLTKASDQMILASSPGVEPANITMAPGKARASQNFMLMYPLFTGGRLRSAELAARSETSSASAESLMAELDVVLAAKIAYDQSLLARSYVEAYKQRVDESRERVRIAEEAYEAGKIARYDLLRNRTDLADSEQQLTNAQRDVQVADADLKQVLGVSQDSDLPLAYKLDSKPAEVETADLQKEALAHRPELAAARSMVSAAEAMLRAAKAAYLPQVYGVAMQDLGAVKDETLGHGSLVGITASIPILDGGLRKSDVAEAQAMLDGARAQERDAVLSVTRDVAASRAELDAASRNVSLARAAVDQADEDYRVIKLRYEAGKSINVEVLDALAALVRAQTNYADALYQRSVAHSKLARAIGRR
jgi:outer membrane protein TolC